MIDFTNQAGFNLGSRHRAEKRFQWTGRLAILLSLAFLAWMVITIAINATGAFLLVQIEVPVDLTTKNVDPDNIADASFGTIIKKGLRSEFTDVTKRSQKKKLYRLVSPEGSFELKKTVQDKPDLLGTTQMLWLTASDDVSLYVRGETDTSLPEDQRRISNDEISWIDQLDANGQIRTVANWGFFTNGDSREPEIAGILAALVGSAFSLSVCFLLSFPIGVAAATYLEEFAPDNKISSVIEININNLAAVPSIVFGLLGLSIFLGYMGLPRSSPLVGGLVLSLMTLPTIIIASRASLKSVPPSIKEAAL
ncbi:MAG: DUF3333 domain-containing protein, partial [Rhodobacteraceae bacterium]|nr:DUF3333 domain-containing protein [Paracoccaceae bacterium]